MLPSIHQTSAQGTPGGSLEAQGVAAAVSDEETVEDDAWTAALRSGNPELLAAVIRAEPKDPSMDVGGIRDFLVTIKAFYLCRDMFPAGALQIEEFACCGAFLDLQHASGTAV